LYSLGKELIPMVLTAKQQAFVKHYLVSLNASKAAIKAGYSSKYVNRSATQLLANPKIQAAIREEIEARNERIQVTQDQVVAELAKVAFGDPRAVMEWGPHGVKLKPSDELDKNSIAQVADIANGGENGPGIKFYDKLKALELLGKHLGMFTDKFSLQGNMEVRHGTDPELEKLIEDSEAQILLAALFARKTSGCVESSGTE
jgi:phage terminase small subunit